MKLYYVETSNSIKPCAVAKYLNSPVEYVFVDMGKQENHTPEYLAMNPNGKVPALAGDDIMLWESHAIMIYLAQKANSNLWPTDSINQIDVLRWLFWDTAHFSRHASRLYYENHIKTAFNIGEADPDEILDASKFFSRFARVLNDHLKGRNYVVGDDLTVADFGIATYISLADKAKLPINEFSEIKRWHDRLLEIPAWQEPFPTN